MQFLSGSYFLAILHLCIDHRSLSRQVKDLCIDLSSSLILWVKQTIAIIIHSLATFRQTWMQHHVKRLQVHTFNLFIGDMVFPRHDAPVIITIMGVE